MRIKAGLLLFFFLRVSPVFYAQEIQRGVSPVQVSIEGSSTRLYNESHALLIGISNYTNGLPSLPGVIKDIQSVKEALKKNGFHVILKLDLTSSELTAAFNEFINQYGQDTANRLLFYYGGHGDTRKMTYGGEKGYLLPSDCPPISRDEKGFLKKAIPMEQIIIYAQEIQSKHALFVFDACFSGSMFSAQRSAPGVIDYKTSQQVRQFLTSGSANETVPDKSIFCQQFIEALKGEADFNHDGYVTGTELSVFLETNVINYSNKTQHPQYGKIRDPRLDKGDFVFVINPDAAATPSAAEKEILVSEKGPDKVKIDKNSPAPAASALPELILIGGGTFKMGSDEGNLNEKPVHEVTVSPFYIGKYEVTVNQFRKFIEETGYVTESEKGDGSYVITPEGKQEKRSGVKWNCDATGNIRPHGEYNHPVVHVTWNDAIAYCKWLSQKTGKTCRLPTEAEWEFAAGNGPKHSKFSWGNDEPFGKHGGNISDESAKSQFPNSQIWNGYDDGHVFTAPVGSFEPNDFGLYDLTGNVSEWCSDWFGEKYYEASPARDPVGPAAGRYHSLRGGSWLNKPSLVFVTTRGAGAPDNRNGYVGFRVVRVK